MARTDPTTIKPDSLGHRSRFSDSSFYDEVCVVCGANDGDGSLSKVCSKAPADDILLTLVTVTETTKRTVLMKANEVEAYRAAFEHKAAHTQANTPPPLPKTALELSTHHYAGTIRLGGER